MAEPIIKLTQVSKTFTRADGTAHEAVRDVSLSLYPGEAMGIVGESGSGKSTLAAMMTRCIDVTAGTLHIDGVDCTHAVGTQLSWLYERVQLIFQDAPASFDPRMTIASSIGEVFENKGLSKSRRKEAIDTVMTQCGLAPSYGLCYPHELSGGQCQRATIARALAAHPRCLVCDEITSALDVMTQARLMMLLKKLKDDGMAFVFICHNLALAQDFCDTLLVMHQGRGVEYGRTDTILSHPTQEYTKRLIDAVL